MSVERIKQFLYKDKKRILTVWLAVFSWGMMAHAYGLLNLTILHDSLHELYASQGDILHRIELGRFMVPIYQFIFHGKVSLPWLNGLLSFCWIAVSEYLTVQMFSMEDTRLIFLTAGIFTVNITVTALTATYIHDLDADMFAVMIAVCAVYLWNSSRKAAWFGIPLLALVLGVYQSILSVYITLVIFVSIIALLQGETAVKVVQRGLQAIGVILIAGGLYLVLVKLSCNLTGIELSSSYNGLTKLFEPKGGGLQYILLVLKAYYNWLVVFSRSSRSLYEMLLLHALLAIPTVIGVMYAMQKQALSSANKLLVLFLGALLPLGMNISYVLDGGMVHDLMHYASWLIYLFAILVTDWFFADAKEKRLPKRCSIVTTVVLSLILAADVQTANSAYTKKDLERQATLSIMTTVSAEMNKTEDYIPGETAVFFIGRPQTGVNDLFPNVSHIIGLGIESTISHQATYGAYFRYILQTPLLESKNEIPEVIMDSMMVYPEEGYIQWYENVLVVKLSEDSNA